MKLRYKILNGILAVLALAILSLGIVLSHTSACPPAAEQAAGENTMLAVRYQCYGSPEVLELARTEKPQPAENEVVVRVVAASVNPLDWHYMRGSPYIMRLSSGIGAPADSRMGVDFAGVVDSVGSGVTRFKVGDEVFGGRNGAFAEYVVIPEDRAIAHKPANVSFEQAAAVPIAAITALQALRDSGALESGQRVLINGASGGVGTFAVQIAASMGAEVSGVCSTRNVDLVRSIGADRVFDYKQENYTESGEQFDVIVDMVGNHSLLANRGVMTPDGRLAIVGGPKGNWVGPLKGVLGAMILSPFVDQKISILFASMTGDDLAELAALMESGAVTSVIDRRFELADIRDAITYSESGRARGKIIITVSDS